MASLMEISGGFGVSCPEAAMISDMLQRRVSQWCFIGRVAVT
jgi:hypothetical protein